jgi:hypothetical protein
LCESFGWFLSLVALLISIFSYFEWFELTTRPCFARVPCPVWYPAGLLAGGPLLLRDDYIECNPSLLIFLVFHIFTIVPSKRTKKKQLQ